MDERTLNDLLECSVCLDRLDTTSKVLPCQHTFCRKCLEVIVASHTELRCPECRVLVEIKIDELPPNVLLMRILEGMKNASHNQINSAKLATVFAINGKQQTMAQNIENVMTGTPPTNQQHINQTNSIKTPIGPSQPPQPVRTAEDVLILRQLQLQQQQQQEPQQQVQTVVNNKSVPAAGGPTVTPHCRALYDFISKEPGDLSFRKGDIINLRRRIDLNWFLGEINNREGAFPANHVQVVVPLPTPQCKALYDFRMGPNEEEGCLTFKKGAIISVFRRVDQNWAEGRIGDCIGIFPIAFVEMNSLAKQLMDVSAKYLHYAISTRSVPETPLEPNFSSDSSSTLTTTSPNSSNTSNSSSNSSTAPSSPVTNVVATQNTSSNNSTATPAAAHSNSSADHSNKEKRHSFTANNGNQVVSNSNAATATNQPSNRHSSEILSAPASPPATSIESKPQKHSSKSSAHSSHTASDNLTKSSSSSSSNKTTAYKQSNRHQSSLSMANTYVALYPYKAQKSDELDLKKGSVYYVTEICQDGWFKGTNRSHKSGVFPGNYVAPLRHTRDGHSSHSSGASSSKRSTSGAGGGGGSSSSATGHKSSHRGKSSHSESSAVPHPPPELPPRQGGSSSSGSVWSKPLGQHVEAFFSRKSGGSHSNKSNDTKESSTLSNGHGNSKKDNSNSSTSTTVNLIKRFTNIKRSKSPVNTSMTYSMDNPVFEDIVTTTNVSNGAPASAASKRNTIHLSHPVHVRSGSCPSQLLQSLPIDINLGLTHSGKKGNDSAAMSSSYMFGSQRVKGHKERPTLQGMRNNLENNRLRGIPDSSPTAGTSAAHPIQSQSQMSQNNTGFTKQINPSSSSYHRKSQSLDAATISSQIVNTSMLRSVGNSAANKNKGYSYNERFRCIVSYPPNSEFELELQVGDIIYVHKKRDNGWYKGTHSRTGKVGLFPSSFVEPDI